MIRRLLALVGTLFLFAGDSLCQDRASRTSGSSSTTGIFISEFLASNNRGLQDEDGDRSDWLELTNLSGRRANLDGYFLTDDPGDLDKWRLPNLRIPDSGYALIFASGKSRNDLVSWNTIIDWEDDWRYLVPNAQTPREWRDPGFDDSSWGVGPSGFGYGDGDDATFLNADTIYVRREFTVTAAELARLSHILLHVDFDDGIVVYLNGQEVARFNMGSPGTEPDWNDYATGSHEARLYQGGQPESFSLDPKTAPFVVGANLLAIEVHNSSPFSNDLSLIPFLTFGFREAQPGHTPSEHLDLSGGELHTNFRLDKEGGFLALVAPGGEKVVDSVSTFYPPQVADVSYGRDGSTWAYLEPPTPGDSNGSSSSYPGLSAPVDFSKSAGTFLGSFQLVLSGTPANSIHYTLDGSVPDSTSPTYSGPIPISSTTWVRTRAYEVGLAPGPIRSRTYLGLANDVAGFESNLPLVVVDTFGFNIDQESSPYSPRPFRPVTSAFMDIGETGRARLTDPSAYSGNGAMHVRGRSSALFYPKKQYRFEIQDESSDDHDVPLLGLPSESDWVIHGPYSDKSLMRNFLMYDWSRGLGSWAARTRFVELFFDVDGGVVDSDDYRGVYVLMENIKRGRNRVDIPRISPEDEGGGYVLSKDWVEGSRGDTHFVTDTYQDTLIFVEPDPHEMTEEQKAWIAADVNAFEESLAGPEFADPQNGYRAHIDTASFVDYHLLIELSRDVDGFVLSTYLHKGRDAKLHMGPIWDFNFALGNADYFNGWETEGWHHENPAFPHVNPNSYRWYERLEDDLEYLLQYADRWYDLRRTHFRTEPLMGQIDEIALFLNEAQQRNFARWPILGTYIIPNPPGWDSRTTYASEVTYLKDWLRARLEWMDQQIDVEYAAFPPLYLLNGNPTTGGVIDSGDVLTMTDPHGTGVIYYTVDGVDPRLPGGGLSSSATLYGGAITLTDTTRVKARVLAGSDWSALNDVSFILRSEQVVINEINYHSADDFDPGDWVELHTPGDEEVDLTGWSLRDDNDSHVYTFPPGTTMNPGSFLVICEDFVAFSTHFPGVPALGGLGFGFGAGGDQVRVFNAAGQLLDIVDYDDAWPWPNEPDGNGPTLELRHPTLDNDNATSWGGSSAVHGTPAAENSIHD